MMSAKKIDPSKFLVSVLSNILTYSCVAFSSFCSPPFLHIKCFRFVSEALRKMGGKFVEIAGSHVTARVLQVSF